MSANYKIANYKSANYKIANLFMLFLLTYNIMLAVIISYLYFGIFRNTAVGAFFTSPWFLLINQFVGLLLPMFIFRSITEKLNEASQLVSDTNQLNGATDKTIPKKPLGFVNVLLVIVLSLLLQPFMMLISAIMTVFMPNPVAGMIYGFTEAPFLLTLAIIAITPSICEEWVFRGYIQSMYESQPVFFIVLINGLFFGIIHMNLHQFAYAFAMGIVFSYMVYLTKSVFSAVIAHMVVNGTQFSLGYFAIRHMPAGVELYEGEGWASVLALGQLALLILPVVVGLFYVFVRHNVRHNVRHDKCDKGENEHPFDFVFWAVIVVFVGFILVFR